ncbi:MAG: UDP-N-acetylglucosamine 2-epimerase (non-hydrolyzing) [Actinomycetota bacterium]|nr:UDP-N-acetylglucosamine 2-epimerase (non-hydrolyzing) [Actinomycetota bacterium]
MTNHRPSASLPPRSVAVVLGTRPEIIKLSEIVRLLGPAALLIHTGQHYDTNLSEIFFQQFGLPTPDIYLGIGGSARGQQIGEAIQALDVVFADTSPVAVVAQGDTNTVLAAAVAANAREVPLVHVEAGLRSFDRSMPEEHNRVVTDHLSDLLLAPTTTAFGNLVAEAIPEHQINVTGNTVVESVRRLLPTGDEAGSILQSHGVEKNGYVLATMHRPENVDDPGTLEAILRQLAALPIPVIFPVHPRTAGQIASFRLADHQASLRLIDPIGYQEFLALGAGSAFLVSDSGGVQEEVSVYKRPLIVVRRSTERPEVLGTFAELVPPGDDIEAVASVWLSDIAGVHKRIASFASPYGDGTASQQSVNAIKALVNGARAVPN